MTQDGKLAERFQAIYTEMEKVRHWLYAKGRIQTLRERPDAPRERRLHANRNDRRNGEFEGLSEPSSKNTPMPDAGDQSSAGQHADQNDQRRGGQRIRPAGHISPQSGDRRHGARKKEGIVNPTAEELLAIREKVANAEIEAYEDNTVKEPLIPEGTVLKGSPVKKTAQDATLGTTEWTLANGVKVVVKPTTRQRYARGAHERRGQLGGLSILSGRGVLHGRDDAHSTRCRASAKFSATDLKKQLFGQVGFSSALGGELCQRRERLLLAQRPRNDDAAALPEFHAAALRPERLQHADEDAAARRWSSTT